MCRLFGFKSVIKSQIHHSLVHADNALAVQSMEHRDGWGVAYYVAGAPHIVKTTDTALECKIFEKLSGVVSSDTVIAHLRRATLGGVNILNTHPYQYGNWVFAHNGTIGNFDKVKDKILNLIPNELQRFILGTTDSEIVFFLILTHLSKKVSLTKSDVDIKILSKACKDAMTELKAIIGEFSKTDETDLSKNYITFIITNGATMLAHQGGKHLYFCHYKKECPEKDSCPSFSEACLAPTTDGYINHMIFSSEPLEDNNVWQPMKREQIVGVDWRMKLMKS